MSEWQPIETAPRGHKMFLIYAPHSQRGDPDLGFIQKEYAL